MAEHDQYRRPGWPGEELPGAEPPAAGGLAGQQPPFGPRSSLHAGELLLGDSGAPESGHGAFGPPGLYQPEAGYYGPPGPPDHEDAGCEPAGQPEPGYGPADPGECGPAEPGDYGPPESSDSWLADHRGASRPALDDYGPPGPHHPWPEPAGFLLPSRDQEPPPGWRRGLYRATGGLLRLPASAADLHRQDLTGRARTPVTAGHHRVGIISLQGGVGKTTTTICLGGTLAALRGDRIIAVDASPDRGALGEKAGLEPAATVSDLLAERDQIRRYADIRAYTGVTPGRLEVLASGRDPAAAEAFSAADFAGACAVIERFYSICLADCGTGLRHSAMSGVLQLADQLVLVTSPTIDGARSASAALDWLCAHASRDLVRRAVVVLSGTRPRRRGRIDVSKLEQYLGARCLAVATVPHDPHLAEGADVDPGLLRRETADAYLALAALIGDGAGRGAPERHDQAR